MLAEIFVDGCTKGKVTLPAGLGKKVELAELPVPVRRWHANEPNATIYRLGFSKPAYFGFFRNEKPNRFEYLNGCSIETSGVKFSSFVRLILEKIDRQLPADYFKKIESDEKNRVYEFTYIAPTSDYKISFTKLSGDFISVQTSMVNRAERIYFEKNRQRAIKKYEKTMRQTEK